MSDVNISINQELIKPILDAKISAAIVSALGNSQQMIENVIGTVLSMKVDSEGKRRNDSYYDKTSFIEHLCIKEITEATKVAIKEYFTAHGDLLKKAMKKYLDKNTDNIAESFVKQLIQDSDRTYNHYTVEIKPKENQRRN